MTESSFLDTNVVVYAFDDRDKRKQEISLALLDSAPSSRLVLSAQVLSEFYVTVTRKLARPLPSRAAAQTVGDLANLRIVPIDSALVRTAIDTAAAHQLSYWDALIIEAAVADGCRRVLTEDMSDGAVIRGVEIVDPFA